MSERKLTTASYLVLGLVEAGGSVTPYELKSMATETVANFWALPHTQIYAQCDRLTESGLLVEKREEHGRRRRSFSITPAGRKELERWRASDTPGGMELRDLSILKLFFGADPQKLAAEQVEFHQRQLESYERLERETGPHMTEGMLLALQAGIGHSKEFVRFWKRVAERT